jgi:hypothetical protein
MRRFYLITYVLIIGSPALPVHAQNNSLGYGVTACSEFVATYEPRQMMTIFAWAAGFFTGSNMATIASAARYRDVNGLDPALVITRLLDHCTRNPQDAVLHAVQQIYFSAPLSVWKDARPQVPKPAVAR